MSGHRAPPCCTEAKSPPAAGCRRYCKQPTSFFLSACRAVFLFLVGLAGKPIQKNRIESNAPGDDDRHTQRDRGNQFAHILGGSPGGLPDLHPVLPRPRFGTRNTESLSIAKQPLTIGAHIQPHTYSQPLFRADSLSRPSPTRSIAPLPLGRSIPAGV